MENKWEDASQAKRGEMQIIEKYFTPSIEDIRVGYECLWIKDHNEPLNNSNLLPLVFTPKRVAATLFSPINWEREETDNFIPNLMSYKVLYLTKEQIETEGWKEYPYMTLCEQTRFVKGLETLHYNFKTYELEVDDEKGEVDDILFKGECKDINTFRYISKLLKIK